jgi:hypothetical protein
MGPRDPAGTFGLVEPGSLTIVAGDRVTRVEGVLTAGGSVELAPSELERATGWELRDEGLCRGDVCVAVRDRRALLDGDTVSLDGFARLLGRALATEPAARLAVLGDAPTGTAVDGDGLEAPQFTLPDVDGRPVSFADYAGRKRLLVFWSSW